MFRKKLLLATTTALFSVFSLSALAQQKHPYKEHVLSNDLTKKAKIHKKNKKRTEAADTPAALSSPNIKVGIGGCFIPQYGFISQQKDFRTKIVGDPNSDRLNDNGLATSTKLEFRISADANDVRYGGKVKINADTSPAPNGKTSVADKVMLFAEGQYGRFELGSYEGANDRIKISSYTNARATGGIDGDYPFWIRNSAYYVGASQVRYDITNLFWKSPYLPLAANKRSNKLTYYSPIYKGLSLGISYTPDSDMVGTVFEQSKKENSSVVTRKGLGFKNGIEAGVRYENLFDNEAKLILSVMGELGQAKKYSYTTLNGTHNLERHNLNAIEFGAGLEYRGFTVAGSYAHLGKSAAIKRATNDNDSDITNYFKNTKPKGNFWTAGASYTYDAFGISVSYIQSKMLDITYPLPNQEITAYELFDLARYGAARKYQALVIGIDYKILPGVLAFAEYTNFRFSMAQKGNLNPEQYKLNNGNIILTGVKFKF